MKLRKLLALILALMMTICVFAACGEDVVNNKDDEKVEEKTPIELFMELYEKQNGEPMNTEQIEFVKSLMDEEADL